MDDAAATSATAMSSEATTVSTEQQQKQQQQQPSSQSSHQQNPPKDKKRGMKPRSKRNRKRPRSQLNGDSMRDGAGGSSTSTSTSSTMMVIPRVSVNLLELDGRPIYSDDDDDGSNDFGWMLRTIEPYPYCFATFAKQRWLGRSILDVYSTEFGSYPRLYYHTAIVQGRILVNDTKVSVEYVIKGGDVLSHVVHRHEPSVWVTRRDAPWVTIVEETDDVVVVDKPPTLPIHPCGGYHMQCLMNLLEQRHQRPQQNDLPEMHDRAVDGNEALPTNANDNKPTTKLYTIHRLDRLTSGLVILGKSSSVAQKWGKCIQQRSCEKIYLARVAGRFPLNVSSVHKSSQLKNGVTTNKADNQQTSKSLLKRLQLTLVPGSSKEIPLHGEWSSDVIDTDNKSENKTDAVAQARIRNAYTYWIDDGKGEGQRHDDALLLQKVFESKHTVDEWLDSMNSSNEQNNEDVSESNMTWLHLACPTRIAQHKDGICEAGSFVDLDDSLYLKTVKPAHTAFGVVSYDKQTDSTLLICRPYTGRTHQIRIHLQHLGHSIANDPNYGGDMWYGNPNGQKACQEAEQRLNVIESSLGSNGIDDTAAKLTAASLSTAAAATMTTTTAIDIPATEKEIINSICSMVQEKGESIHDFVRRTCVWCARSKLVGGADRAALEFLIRSPGIWLHALQYSFERTPDDGDNSGEENNDPEEVTKMTYRAPLPPWHTLP